MPDATDIDAVRSYGWEDVQLLREVLIEGAKSAEERETTIESIKQVSTRMGTFGTGIGKEEGRGGGRQQNC